VFPLPPPPHSLFRFAFTVPLKKNTRRELYPPFTLRTFVFRLHPHVSPLPRRFRRGRCPRWR
jgi:hypothetical protein